MENAAERLARALVKCGHPTTVLTASSADLPVDRMEHGVRVLRVIKPLAFGPLWGLTYMRQTAKWLRKLKNDWDFVLCHELYLHSIMAARVARELGKPSATLLVNAGDYSDLIMLRSHKGGKWLVRESLKMDSFFTLSRLSERELIEKGVPIARIESYRNFVDMEEFSPSQEASHNPNEFLYLGRFRKQKNLPLLIEAFSAVWKVRPHARLRVIGNGVERDTVEKAIARSPARDAITLEEWTDNPVQEFRRSLATVTATHAEGLSNVLVETLSCGTPAITTDVSGVRDTLDPEGKAPEPIPAGEFFQGIGGLIVPTGDPEALTDAMLRLLDDASLREDLAIQARQHASRSYCEETCVGDFLRAAERISRRVTSSS